MGEEAGQGPLFPGDSQPACLPLLGSFLDPVSVLSKRHISHLRAVRQGQICPLCLVPENLDILGFLPPNPCSTILRSTWLGHSESLDSLALLYPQTHTPMS